ncbi:MAG: Glu/Leu/Phe/Val dehydrogenase, partial [Candidatus Obscuribacterales bacterium]|nr:Glu/Leu/Phe/Val dehydrogenase [Candidatus Obscuribacterales bacterium]
RYCSEIIELIGPNQDVQSPDLNTDAQTMAWMLDTYSVNVGHTVPSIVTGKPQSIGGSLSATDATGYGVALVARNVLRHINLKTNNPTVAIQGFGAIGSAVAKGLSKMGFKIVAVSDSRGAIHNPKGLDMPALFDYQATNGSIYGFAKATAISNSDLLGLDCDILAPCSVRNQINLENVETIACKVIVEGANAPITPEADEILESKGITVVPDILANGAGVTVGYFEWVQGMMRLLWTEEEVLARLEELVNQICQKVFAVADEYQCSLRMAAMRLAIDRVVEARWLRGLYP